MASTEHMNIATTDGGDNWYEYSSGWLHTHSTKRFSMGFPLWLAMLLQSLSGCLTLKPEELPYFYFSMNGNTERAHCVLSQICLP